MRVFVVLGVAALIGISAASEAHPHCGPGFHHNSFKSCIPNKHQGDRFVVSGDYPGYHHWKNSHSYHHYKHWGYRPFN